MSESNPASEHPNYIFGPVPSRRLGRSLGVDLVPFKTCTYDCVYCQLGCTTCKTMQRKSWVPMDSVLAQLESHLASCPDYITLSGSGEPTLFTPLAELIDRMKTLTDIPVAVLTNGSLLSIPDVRRSIMAADLIVPSLDAGTAQAFAQINRPHKDIAFDTMLDGLIAMRQEFSGDYWLEVFLLDGMNTSDSQINALANAVARIAPDRIQVNTVTRPPAEPTARGIAPERLAVLAARLHDDAEVIADYHHVHERREFTVGAEDVLTLLRRRPCSIDDIAAGLGFHRNEALKYVESLLSSGRIEQMTQHNRRYYVAVSSKNSESS